MHFTAAGCIDPALRCRDAPGDLGAATLARQLARALAGAPFPRRGEDLPTYLARRDAHAVARHAARADPTRRCPPGCPSCDAASVATRWDREPRE